jgi:hypothetical protein
MVELLCGAVSQIAWQNLLESSRDASVDKQLEILFAHATWAKRAGHEADARESQRVARTIGDGADVWLDRFQALLGTSDVHN